MFKGKAVPASELRPFSIDDPDGSGRRGPNAAERRILEMRRRLQERRARSRKDKPTLERRPARSSNAEKRSRRAEREVRAATPTVTASVLPAQLRRTALTLTPDAPADQHGSQGRQALQRQQPGRELLAPTKARWNQPKRQRASQKKRGGCGCLGCLPLLLLGAFLFSAAPQAVSFVEHQVRNEMLRHGGAPALAQILAIERRGFPVSDRKLYELTLQVHSADGRNTRATVQQFFPAHVTEHLRLGSWVQVHIDPQDLSRAVVLSVGHAPPSKAAPRPTQHL